MLFPQSSHHSMSSAQKVSGWCEKCQPPHKTSQLLAEAILPYCSWRNRSQSFCFLQTCPKLDKRGARAGVKAPRLFPFLSGHLLMGLSPGQGWTSWMLDTVDFSHAETHIWEPTHPPSGKKGHTEPSLAMQVVALPVQTSACFLILVDHIPVEAAFLTNNNTFEYEAVGIQWVPEMRGEDWI